jgi:hypothetical protein
MAIADAMDSVTPLIGDEAAFHADVKRLMDWWPWRAKGRGNGWARTLCTLSQSKAARERRKSWFESREIFQ